MFGCSRFRPSPVFRRLGAAVAAAPAVGFCGWRGGWAAPSGEVAFLSLAALLPVGCPVLVGDARGVDSAVRSVFPGASVFRVSGRGRGAVVARSVAFVRAVAASGGVLVVFPGARCPVGVVPSAAVSACFCGSGSGSWASAALAAGSGVPLLVWVPVASWVPRSWGLVPLGGGWFGSVPF